MAEHFSFFDAVQLDDGTYEEEYEYDAQKFTDYFNTLVTTGVMKGIGNMLAVSASGSNMITKVNTGIAFIEGRYYKNDSFKELTHDTETLGNSRIDRIVVRMDLSTESRYVKSFIKKGVPSTNPVPPTLTQTANLYEISLAQVKIVGGQTFIATDAVTDERGKDVICRWAGSNILPNFSDSSLGQPNGIATLDGAGLIPLSQLSKASPGVVGVVEISNSISSPSQTIGATSYAVKSLNDKLEGQWVTIPHSSPFDNLDASYYPTRIKRVGGLAVVEAYLRLARTLSGNTILNIPDGYRSRVPFSFRIYRQRGSTYTHMNGVCTGGGLVIEAAEQSSYQIGDYIQLQVVYGVHT